MKKFSILVMILVCFAATLPAFAGEAAQIKVTPTVLDIDAFYDGTTLNVSGTVPADSNVVLRFVGATCELHMKERGKVLGVMWMNLDSLTFRGVPNVCLVSSAVAFDNLAAAPEQGMDQPVKKLALAGIRDAAKIESAGFDEKKAFEELLKLKKREGLYRETVGNITYGPAADSTKTFQATIPVPSRLTPGDYRVELAAISNGQIVARADEPVKVKLVGFPALLANLAFGHSALYGILATIIALVAGLAVGIVFQSKGAH